MEYTTGRTPLSMPNTLSDVLNHEDVAKLTEKENQHKKRTVMIRLLAQITPNHYFHHLVLNKMYSVINTIGMNGIAIKLIS